MMNYSRLCSERGSVLRKLTDNLPQKSMSLFLNGSLKCNENALDAMQGDGTIIISAYPKGSYVMVDIEDTGEFLGRRIARFSNQGFTTKTRGWGLGLSLAKRIIEDYHRGKILRKVII